MLDKLDIHYNKNPSLKLGKTYLHILINLILRILKKMQARSDQEGISPSTEETVHFNIQLAFF